MPLPRAPKVERQLIDRAQGPTNLFPPAPADPLGRLGDTPRWLRYRSPNLERLVGDAWVPMEGGYSVFAFVAPDRAVVAFEQTELRFMNPAGETQLIWSGPRMQQIDQAIWGGNWMFGAAALADGRFVASVPDPEQAERPLGSRLQRVVLFAADGTPLDSLPLFERTASVIKKGYTSRFISRVMEPALGGQVVVMPCAPELMVLGVFGDRIAWIGKGTSTDGGGTYSDGTEVLLSSGLYNSKVRFWRLTNLAALYAKAQAKLG